MDNPSKPAESQQAQLYYQQYHQQEATAPQAYDPSTQAYYSSYSQYSHTPNQPHQETQYSYYYPGYSNAYQSQPQVETSSVHAPGVPIPVETQETHVQNHPNVYYTHGLSNPQQQPQTVYAAPRHSAFAARGGRGGRYFRGGRRGGHSGSSRGRGRGRVQATASATTVPGQAPQPPSSAPGNAVAPPRMAWCELCRVDCTTAEVLEVHRNGKKHKKNLKIHEELQSLNGVSTGMQNPQPVPDSNVQAAQPEMNVISEADNPESSGGVKRKAKGGRGGKWMKGHDGSRKAVGPPKPKQVTSLFCQLCNVKCETPVVFDSHMAGKKHLANVKRFEGHQATFGGDVQALYPPIPNVPPTLFTTTGQPCVSEAQAPVQAQVLASSLVNQQAQAQDPNAQAALVQLLNQHGIGDAQALLAQLVPFLLAQVQPNGTEPGNPAQPGAPSSGALAQVQPNGAPPGGSTGPGELDSCALGAVTGPALQDQTNSLVQAQIPAGDNCSEMAIDKSEGATDKSDLGGAGPPTVNDSASGEQADVAGEKSVVAESDNGYKPDIKD